MTQDAIVQESLITLSSGFLDASGSRINYSQRPKKRSNVLPWLFFTFMVQRVCQTATRVINLPVAIPTTPSKALLNVCAWEPKCSMIWHRSLRHKNTSPPYAASWRRRKRRRGTGASVGGVRGPGRGFGPRRCVHGAAASLRRRGRCAAARWAGSGVCGDARTLPPPPSV